MLRLGEGVSEGFLVVFSLLSVLWDEYRNAKDFVFTLCRYLIILGGVSEADWTAA